MSTQTAYVAGGQVSYNISTEIDLGETGTAADGTSPLSRLHRRSALGIGASGRGQASASRSPLRVFVLGAEAGLGSWLLCCPLSQPPCQASLHRPRFVKRCPTAPC
jgi:hypothetical protein